MRHQWAGTDLSALAAQKSPCLVRAFIARDAVLSSTQMMSERHQRMVTQEERITTLEPTTREYRPVLQSFAYAFTMVKGLIIEQASITQEVNRGMHDVKMQLVHIEEQLHTILTLLSPS